MSLRILFVTPYVPSSVRIRPLAFIRELARRGHQVVLVCLVQPEWEARYLEEVSPYCWAVHPVHLKRFEPYPRVLASLVKPEPLSVAYCDSPGLRQKVQQQLLEDNCDLIHTEFVRAAPATMNLNGHPKVFDLVDCLALAYRRCISATHMPLKQRAVAGVEWAKMRGYERHVLSHYNRVLVSSPADRNEIGIDEQVEVLPNGVDLSYFSYHVRETEAAEIVFVGKMSYYVNVASVLWFYHQVFPQIRKQRPDARFVIVGRNPARSIEALSADPAVEVTGTVADVRPYLNRAAVAICPMVSGSGIQNKMLEAMATGVPCVATSLACQALDIVSGREVLVANEAGDFANAVLDLLGQPLKRRELSEASRCYVEQCHNWNTVGARLEKVFFSLSEN